MDLEQVNTIGSHLSNYGPPRRTVNVEQAASLLGLSRRTIYNWIAWGWVGAVASSPAKAPERCPTCGNTKVFQGARAGAQVYVDALMAEAERRRTGQRKGIRKKGRGI